MRFSPPTAAIIVASLLLLIVKVSSFQSVRSTGRNTVRTQQRWPPKPVTSAHLFGLSLQQPAQQQTSRWAPQTRRYEKINNENDSPNYLSTKRLFVLNLVRRWTAFRINAARCLTLCRKTATSLAFALLVVFSCHAGSAWAVSGGRMGGSFGGTKRYSSPSHSTSHSRVMPRSLGRGYSSYSMAPRMHVGTRLHGSYATDIFPGQPPRVATKFSPKDIALLTTTTAVMAYGFTNNKRRQEGTTSPLGPGATVAQVTISLNVRDRNNPNSLLSRLAEISEKHDTNDRKGVQNLVSDVALELLRQEDNIVSAEAQSEQFSTVGPAQREFERQSVQGRSKFDRETVNKFGDQDRPDQGASRSDSADGDDADTTTAMVNIKLSIEGDSTRMPGIRYRKDLREALERIAGDAQVEDCLMSAEILWAPEQGNDRMTPDDIYSNYPNLIPL